MELLVVLIILAVVGGALALRGNMVSPRPVPTAQSRRRGASTTNGQIAIPAGKHRFSMVYADADGVVTEREVTVEQVMGRQVDRALWPDALRGWCHLRQEARTFAVSRIERMTDAHTGDTVDKPVAIRGMLRLALPGDHATRDDRRFAADREWARAEALHVPIRARPVVRLNWRPAHGRAQPRETTADIVGFAAFPDGTPFAVWAQGVRSGSEDMPYFLDPAGSGVRHLLSVEEEGVTMTGTELREWVRALPERKIGGEAR